MSRKITTPITGEEYQILSDLHGGQGDLVYHVISRTDPGEITKISVDEVVAIIDRLEEVIDEPELFNFHHDEMVIIRRMRDYFQALLNPEQMSEDSDTFISKNQRAQELVEEATDHLNEAADLMSAYPGWDSGKQFIKPLESIEKLLLKLKKRR